MVVVLETVLRKMGIGHLPFGGFLRGHYDPRLRLARAALQTRGESVPLAVVELPLDLLEPRMQIRSRRESSAPPAPSAR